MRVRWVKVWVDSLATLTERFRDEDGRVDFEALGREEYAFRHALVTGDFSRSERARDLYDATINEITSRSEAGRKGAEARWSKNTAATATRDGVDVSTTGCNPSSPDASSGNAEEVVPHGSPKGSRSNCTSGTSEQTFEAPQNQARESQPGAGEVPPENISAKPSPALPVPAKRPHGEFGNVLLTDDEFAKLCEKCADADSLITELDQYIESQGKTKKYKSHYATLLNWSRRKAQESKPKQGFKTAAEKQRDELQKIADYYASKEVVG